jgi:hypothetical protein
LITNVPTNAEEIENGTNSAASQSSASSPFSKLKGFKIGQINIASLVKHYHELLLYMQSKCFDILTVNETRLDKSVCDYEVEIPGYDIIRWIGIEMVAGLQCLFVKIYLILLGKI